VAWIHRRAGDRDIYFVASQVAAPMNATVTFRVAGKVPEFWNPETGTITTAAVWRTEDGRTRIPLHFTPFGSTFVVFRPGHADAVQAIARDGKACPEEIAWRRGDAVGIETDVAGSYELKLASGHTLKTTVHEVPLPIDFAGPWQVKFPQGWGAPPQAQLEAGSWTANDDPGIRYFSGTVTYEREFDMPVDRLGPDLIHYLDLGKVKNLAEVVVNGLSVGILWKPPYRLEITRLLKPGRNRLEIKVTNPWLNRMVGDEQQPDDCEWENGIKHIPDWVWTGGPRPQKGRYTFTTWKFYNQNTPLLESGLIGPVSLQSSRRVELPIQ